MKRFFAFLCAVSILLLCACTGRPSAEDTQVAPTTQNELPTQTIMQENALYSVYNRNEPELSQGESILAVVCNEPFDGTEPEATITWMEGEYDRAYIIPRSVGSTVALYELIWDDEAGLTRSEEPLYKAENCEDGCVIYGAFFRPEGMSIYYLEVTDATGAVGGYELSYNGNTGTPAREYVIGS